MSCAFQPFHPSLAERRNFSSPKILVISLLIVKESQKEELCEIIRLYSKVINIEQLERNCRAIDDEIEQDRNDVRRACLKFEKEFLLLKRFDNFVSNNAFIKTQFEELSLQVKQFYNQYRDILMFDDRSVQIAHFFNKKLLYEMRKFATKYDFSKN